MYRTRELIFNPNSSSHDVLKIQKLACTFLEKSKFRTICFKLCLRETTAQLHTWEYNSRSRSSKIVHFSPTINIVYMTIHYPKLIYFQMNWSMRKKSLKPSLTNLTKPSLKCRVTKPCAVKKTLMQLSSFPHQLGRPQRCLGAWKIIRNICKLFCNVPIYQQKSTTEHFLSIPF